MLSYISSIRKGIFSLESAFPFYYLCAVTCLISKKRDKLDRKVRKLFELSAIILFLELTLPFVLNFVQSLLESNMKKKTYKLSKFSSKCLLTQKAWDFGDFLFFDAKFCRSDSLTFYAMFLSLKRKILKLC